MSFHYDVLVVNIVSHFLFYTLKHYTVMYTMAKEVVSQNFHVSLISEQLHVPFAYKDQDEMAFLTRTDKIQTVHLKPDRS